MLKIVNNIILNLLFIIVFFIIVVSLKKDSYPSF